MQEIAVVVVVLLGVGSRDNLSLSKLNPNIV
jgi:hypothetical protein